MVDNMGQVTTVLNPSLGLGFDSNPNFSLDVCNSSITHKSLDFAWPLAVLMDAEKVYI